MFEKDQDIPALPFRNIEHSGRQLFSTVNKIPPEAAKAVADIFMNIAAELQDIHQAFLRQQAIEKKIEKTPF